MVQLTLKIVIIAVGAALFTALLRFIPGRRR